MDVDIGEGVFDHDFLQEIDAVEAEAIRSRAGAHNPAADNTDSREVSTGSSRNNLTNAHSTAPEALPTSVARPKKLSAAERGNSRKPAGGLPEPGSWKSRAPGSISAGTASGQRASSTRVELRTFRWKVDAISVCDDSTGEEEAIGKVSAASSR